MNITNFLYQGYTISVLCQKKDVMRDIIQKFFYKAVIEDPYSFFFVYNGNIVDKNLTFGQIAKNNKDLTILVIKNDCQYGNEFDENIDRNNNKITVKINYLNKISEIICEPEEKMGDIYQKFSIIRSLDKNSIYLWYNKRTIVQNVKIEDYLNFGDKKIKEMELYATSKNSYSIKKSNHVFCPICGESAIMKVKNYKLSICECKNDHNINDLNINDFETSQLINESNIICYKCQKNKAETYKNEFYVCNTCNLYLCPLCKVMHNKKHIIYKYENEYGDKDFICYEHDKTYVSYCKKCKKNLCSTCEKAHNKHDFIKFSNLFTNNQDSEIKLNDFKNSIDKFKNDIKKIIKTMNKVIENCEKFYKMYEEINHVFNKGRINYYILKMLNEFFKDDISDNMNNVVKLENYNLKINQIFKMYNCMYNNELKIDEQQSEDIKKLINEKDKIITKQKEKEKELIQKLEKLENDENKYDSKKVKELMEEISQKNTEIKELHSYIPFKLAPGEKLMTVIFISDDQKVHYSFICKNTDKFKDLESRLYDVYPEYSESDNYFLANGRKIIRFKDLDYNQIKNSDIITLYYETD